MAGEGGVTRASSSQRNCPYRSIEDESSLNLLEAAKPTSSVGLLSTER